MASLSDRGRSRAWIGEGGLDRRRLRGDGVARRHCLVVRCQSAHRVRAQGALTLVQPGLLDLDYITRWAEPAAPGESYGFWVAPATLLFERVVNLRIENDSDGDTLEIADINRDGDAWHVEGQNFDMRFGAAGFRQTFRSLPVLQPRQSLTLAQRGGYSFDELPAQL